MNVLKHPEISRILSFFACGDFEEAGQRIANGGRAMKDLFGANFETQGGWAQAAVKALRADKPTHLFMG